MSLSIPHSMVLVYQHLLSVKDKPNHCIDVMRVARATGLREGNCAGLLRRLEDLDILDSLHIGGGKCYVWTGKNKHYLSRLEECAKVYADIAASNVTLPTRRPEPMF